MVSSNSSKISTIWDWLPDQQDFFWFCQAKSLKDCKFQCMKIMWTKPNKMNYVLALALSLNVCDLFMTWLTDCVELFALITTDFVAVLIGQKLNCKNAIFIISKVSASTLQKLLANFHYLLQNNKNAIK